VLTYFDFFTAAPPLAGLALKGAKAKRVELDVAAIEGAPRQTRRPSQGFGCLQQGRRRRRAQLNEVQVGRVLRAVWPVAACAPARSAAPEPRRRVAVRRWGLSPAVSDCMLRRDEQRVRQPPRGRAGRMRAAAGRQAGALTGLARPQRRSATRASCRSAGSATPTPGACARTSATCARARPRRLPAPCSAGVTLLMIGSGGFGDAEQGRAGRRACMCGAAAAVSRRLFYAAASLLHPVQGFTRVRQGSVAGAVRQVILELLLERCSPRRRP